jgi:hypothetical protein
LALVNAVNLLLRPAIDGVEIAIHANQNYIKPLPLRALRPLRSRAFKLANCRIPRSARRKMSAARVRALTDCLLVKSRNLVFGGEFESIAQALAEPVIERELSAPHALSC